MTRLAGRFSSWAFAVGIGGSIGIGFHWMLPRPVFGRDTAGLTQVRSLLGCYEQRLAEFSKAAEVFSYAQFADRTTLIESVRPLKAVIENENAAYAALSRNRFSLLADIASQGGRERDLQEASNALGQVDEFQWHRLRPTENGLLVDIIAVWQGTGDAQILEQIREQQRQQERGWPDLCRILADGIRQFRSRNETHRCDPTTTSPASHR
jgi:hypothetical protein